ncbi:MAG: zinc ABC transporter substrate-binding protein [Bacteroidota bacterium]
MQRYIRHFFGTVTFIAIWSVGLAQQNNRPKVVATTTFLADMTRNIAGGEAEVISLMPVNEDPHTYEPVPGDARRIAEADLIIKNGLTLEGWLDEMINSSGTQADILVATNGIYPIQSADHVGATDPHAWMDVRNGLIYITNIRDALIRLLPNKGADISQNHDRYQQKLLELDAYIQSQIQSIPPQQRIIATTHDAFRYFGNRYGLKVESILGTSTDSEARIADYQRLVRQIEVAGVPAVFIESTLDPKALQQLA